MASETPLHGVRLAPLLVLQALMRGGWRVIDPYDAWEPWPVKAILDGNVLSIIHYDREDTEHMPRRAPVGFTAKIPPMAPMVRLRDLSPDARALAKASTGGWRKRDLMTQETAAMFEKTAEARARKAASE